MRRIYKYEIVPGEDLSIPCSRALYVGNQLGKLCLWAEIPFEMGVHVKSFRAYGTGQEIPNDSVYVGTAMIEPFVWHVYEIEEH